MYEEYLISFHKTDIINILTSEDAGKHYSVQINFILLFDHQPSIVKELLSEPDKCIDNFNTACTRAQLVLLREAVAKSTLKINVHCRIYQFPALSDVRRSVFPGNHDAGKFLQVSGTVLRVTDAKLLEYQRNYVCMKCKKSILVNAEYDRKYMIKQPKKCQNPDGCGGTNLVHLGELESDNCRDYQEIKIQELVNKLGVGTIPDTMWVTLEDDLVDCCKPGDNVTICGVLVRRWGEFCKGKRIEIDLVLKANNVQVDNIVSSTVLTSEVKEMFHTFWDKYSKNCLDGRDVILRSICPQIYGLYLVKLAVAVVLAGGCQTEDCSSTGVHTRAEPHLLLVGDPGTGKSHLLRFASKMIRRSVLTTGIGSTAAGLTVTAIKEHGEWQLEAGALVMADGGICCIDEFNSMKEHDRTSIHEAMEQQTISVAKASIVCKLNTRCSILAACNPKGNIDTSQPLCMSLALPSPLLSRFDLVLMLRDTVNEEWDGQVADYILNGGNNFSTLTDCGQWNVDILQLYYMQIKNLKPKLTDDAETILSSYYQMQRRIDSRNKARTTVRLLESLVRLSQGHARLMYHQKVEIVDSIYAIVLVDAAMEKESSIFDFNLNTNSIFPEKPVADYCRILETLLEKLQLPVILQKEITLLSKNVGNMVQSRFFVDNENIENNQIESIHADEFEQEAKVFENVNNKNILHSTRIDESLAKLDSGLDFTCSQITRIELAPQTSKGKGQFDNTANITDTRDFEQPSTSTGTCLKISEFHGTKHSPTRGICSGEANQLKHPIKTCTKINSIGTNMVKTVNLPTTEDSGFDDVTDSAILTENFDVSKANLQPKSKSTRHKQKSTSNVDKSYITTEVIDDKNTELTTSSNISNHQCGKDSVAKVNYQASSSRSSTTHEAITEIKNNLISPRTNVTKLRSSLKKFKYSRRNLDETNELEKLIQTDVKGTTGAETLEEIVEDTLGNKSKIPTPPMNPKKSKIAKKIDYVDNHLELLEYMPSIADSLNFDMNIDLSSGIETKSFTTNLLNSFDDSSQNSTNNFSSKATFKRNLASNIGNKSMFESADDDLDFEL